MTDALIGKTIASVEEKQMAGRDTFKDIVTWTATVLHFTDGTSETFGGPDTEVYDAFEYDEVDENGWPIEPVRPTGFEDCSCDPAVGHTSPCLLTPDPDHQPCIKAGEHLKGQRHRWQECPVYHEGEER
jgi:hypothetical protein